MAIKQEQLSTQQGQTQATKAPVGTQVAQTQVMQPQAHVMPAEQPGALATTLPRAVSILIASGYPIVPFNLPEVPEISEELKQELATEMAGLNISFDRVKIPAGGGIFWELPAEEGQKPKYVEELVGVIVDHYPIKSWYQEPYSGGNEPPDCSSLDCITGITKEGVGRSCASCPMGQKGSNPKNPKRKWCDDKQRIYLLQNCEDAFPILINLPPGSLSSLGNWLGKKVIIKGLHSYDVLAKITLTKATSTDGIVFSQANFAIAGPIDPAITDGMRAYSNSIKTLTRRQIIAADDYEAAGQMNEASPDSYEEPGTETPPTQKVYTGKAEVLPEEPIF